MTSSSRVLNAAKAQRRQSQLEEAKRLTQELVELLDRRSDLHGVHYLTIEREWVSHPWQTRAVRSSVSAEAMRLAMS